VKEAQAVAKSQTNSAVAQAQVDAAQARAELADLELERCTLRAPFAGRLLAVAVSPGQFLPKGAKVADLADVSSLRVLVPIDRANVAVGGSINISVEGQVVAGKVQATLPLPETHAPLRELATAFTAAWVAVPNPKGDLEPGQRVLSPSLPTSPLATIPSRAVREPARGEAGGPSVQVIRNEYVTDIPVRVLGHPGPERTQVSGLFRPNDALIVSSSVPLLAGTLIRFSGSTSEGGIEPTNPNPAEGGELAGIVPPRGAGSRAPSGASTKTRTPPKPSGSSFTTKPSTSASPATKGNTPPPF
jgi:multidrug efflux pump subunit AcrA (membrane-fusion protein)